jgi:hypothetical protein
MTMIEINAETLKPVIIWLRDRKQIPASSDSRIPSKFVLTSEVNEHIKAAIKEAGDKEEIEQTIVNARGWLFANGDIEVPTKQEQDRLSLLAPDEYVEIG